MGSGFSNDVCVAKNFNTANDGTKDAKIVADGQLMIGSTALPNIRVGTLTAGTGIAVTNGAGSITIASTPSSAAISSVITESGAPGVAPNAIGVIDILGGANIDVTGTGPGNIVTVAFSGILPVANGGTGNNTLTDHGILLGSDAGPVTVTAAPTNGQLLIGSGGLDPVLALPTNGNNISWTGGAGTLTANLTGTTDKTIQLGNAGGSLTSAAALTNGQLLVGNTGNAPTAATLTAGAGISITNAAGSITIAAGGGSPIYTYTEPGAYPYNVLTTDYCIGVDTTAARTIRMPNAPTTGSVWVIKDYGGNAAAQNISVTTVGGAVLIDSAATYAINVNYGSITLLFNGTKYLVI